MFPTSEDIDHPLKHLLHTKIFRTLSLDHFKVQYMEDVSKKGFCTDLALGIEQHALATGKVTIYRMPDGIAVAHGTDSTGSMWAAFETAARVVQREQRAKWQSFALGHWTLDCPTEPGIYPVCARSCAVRHDTPFGVHLDWRTRTLRRIEGNVRDVTEFTPSTHRTLWRGYWWSEPLPSMVAPMRDE